MTRDTGHVTPHLWLGGTMQLVTHTGQETDGAEQCGNITISTIYCDYLYYLLSPVHHSSVPMSTLSTPPPAAALNTT